jgi:hypothetical protein
MSRVNELSAKPHWNHISIGWFSVALLPAMISLTPFLIFLDHFSYDLSDSGTVISLAILIGISLFCSILMFVGGRISHGIIVAVLVTLFIDIQFDWIAGGSGLRPIYAWLGVALTLFMISWLLKENFFRICTAIFAVFFVVTLGQLVWDKPSSKLSFAEQAPSVKAQPLPRVIHLVLDEHIGIEGIPIENELGKQMKDDLMSFYQRNGFAVFGEAYSHFYKTQESIPRLLNFSSSLKPLTGLKNSSLVKSSNPPKLLRNRYFHLLFDRGYKINVLPNAMYLDYCSENMGFIENCVKVPPFGMKLLKNSNLVVMDKLWLIFSHYRSLGYTYLGATNLFNKLLGVSPESSEKGEKKRAPWGFKLKVKSVSMTLTSLLILDDLSDIVLSLPQGHVLYSHLIFPHYPYIVQSDCSLSSSLNQWKTIGGNYSQGQRNTLISREERYRAYFQQTRCIYRKLDKLFEQMRKVGMYDDSIVIVHGDHGSRITRIEPFAEYSARLSRQDLKDSFSTLFAVKLSNGKAHYDNTVRSLEDLLAESLSSVVPMGEQPAEKESEPFVYLAKEKYGEFTKFPYVNYQ